MIGVFDRYVAMRLLRSFTASIVIVMVLIILFNSIELLREASDETAVGPLLVMTMAALHAPSVAIKTLPFVMLLSALWTFIALSRANELVSARVGGRSFWRLAMPAIIAAVLLGLAGATGFNPIAAAALNQFDRLDARYFDGRASLLSVSAAGLWLREGSGGVETVVRARSANNDGTALRDVTLFEFDAEDGMTRRLDADRAILENGSWRLERGIERTIPIGTTAEPPLEERFERMAVPTTLTAARIQDSFAAPDAVSFWRLPAFIDTLENSGFSARRHRTHWHVMLSLPLLFGAMTLVAAAFAIRPPRFAKFGRIALGCALTGFALYFVTDVSVALGSSGAVPPPVAAWAPTISAVLTGAALAFYFEES